MLQAVLDASLAAVFVAAAVGKLRRPGVSARSLTTFGLRAPRARGVALGVLVVLELGLAAGIAAGSAVAAWSGAALLLGFSAIAAVALRRHGAGAPCACFGAGSRLSRLSVVRNVLLAGALAGSPALGDTVLDTQGLLIAGLLVCLVGVVGLAIAVLALARELGVLRRELIPTPALEIPEEGPAVGSRTALAERFALGAGKRWALAVFSSDACPMCQALAPAVAALGRHPLVAVQDFDEYRDALVWRALKIPGSPFAVVMDRAGQVLCKGTFNSPAQLDGLLATAERRGHLAGHG